MSTNDDIQTIAEALTRLQWRRGPGGPRGFGPFGGFGEHGGPAERGASVSAVDSEAVGTRTTSPSAASVIPVDRSPHTAAGVRSSACSSPSSGGHGTGSQRARRCDRRRSAARVRLVSQGVELGLLRREADPDDARRTLIALTDKGRAITNRFRGAQRENVDQALSTFTEEERAQLASLLTRLADAWPK